MFHKFTKYYQQHSLITLDDRVLVAISGGADSVALCHLLQKIPIPISLAHCNFSLRGEESDEDERFVQQLAKSHHIKAHFITFQTREYANQHKISIEMAARDLRYRWFESLCQEFGYTKIAVGHHLNDAIETIFLNMIRGTGIRGIAGMAPINGKIIRPLLFATRQQIETYCSTEGLDYRHDSSNDSDEYQRNKIRNLIVPEFKKMNPSFEETMQHNMAKWNQVLRIYDQVVETELAQWVKREGQTHKIEIQKLIQHHHTETLLFEFLSPFGFSNDTIQKTGLSLTKEPGRQFFSETHQLLIDRQFIMVEPLNQDTASFQIHDLDGFGQLSVSIRAEMVMAYNYSINHSAMVAQIDADKITFPLTLRHWKAGDSFYPLGMKQSKKLSDFFTDAKLDRFTKDKIWLLESAGNVVWVVGLRMDDRYKITSKTKRILLLTSEW
ncbi:MAG TPA: tRNA lysidine(34) synthetase TilS [Marinilabiliales bacterium]|nr:tRNA lysidine(34) synthetase TilS [Marinilabiliales bacterium]